MAKKRVAPRTYYFLIGHLQRLIPTVAIDARIDTKERGEIEAQVAALTSLLSKVNTRQYPEQLDK